jgi:hypothetical protein
LNGRQMTQDRLFVEITAPGLKTAKSGARFGANPRDSPAVPLLSVPPVVRCVLVCLPWFICLQLM